MLVKVCNVCVELDVHAVTCPGVWLCPNGKIILKLFMFGSSARASHLPPIFPLLYHQKFVFQKTFPNVRYLTDLQHLLGKEFIHAELIQSYGGSEVILASFETTVLELLYPSPCLKGLIAGVDIDLLMEPRKCFPGILGPKIKVSTKTTIEEVLDTSSSNKRNPGLINHKLLTSKNSSASKRCYQNKIYHDKHQPPRSPELRKKLKSLCCKQTPSLSAVMPNTDGCSMCTCGHCQVDTTGIRSLYSQSAETFQDSSAQLPIWASRSGRVYSPCSYHNIVKVSAPEKEEHHTKWRKTRKDFQYETCHGCKCHDSHSHKACNCPVCSKYRTYFDKHTAVDRSAEDTRKPCKHACFRSTKCTWCELPSCPDRCCCKSDVRMAGAVHQCVHRSLAPSHYYPFRRENDIPSSLKCHCNISDQKLIPCCGKSQYRAEFYHDLEKFYRKLYKEGKQRTSEDV